MSTKVCLLTLGCKVNSYEADCIAAELARRGAKVLNELGHADVYILTTCAVTNEAERKSRQMLTKLRKLNPQAKIVVCGCAAQNAPQNFEGQPNVSIVLGNSGKHWIPDLLTQNNLLYKNAENTKSGLPQQDKSKTSNYAAGTPETNAVCKQDAASECKNFVVELPLDYEELGEVSPGRTRAYLKVQDGCNQYCAYCLIPYIRGRSRSRNTESILIEAFRLAKEAKEIVLTGINLSDYGNGLEGEFTLADLISSLSTINARIRLSSLEVSAITKDFLTAAKNSANFCPHFHLSLQSGCDSVLKRMNRPYTAEEYLDRVQAIRQVFPDAGITTDVIVGFPEETEEEFNITLNSVRKAGFADIHVFPYSRRAGTEAAKLKQVDGNIVKERVTRLAALRTELREKFLKSQIGKSGEVLTETFKDGHWNGHTPNFIKVYFKPSKAYTENCLVRVRLVKPYLDGMLGEE